MLSVNENSVSLKMEIEGMIYNLYFIISVIALYLFVLP